MSLTKLIQQDGYLSEAKQMRHGYIKAFQIVLVSIFASGQPSWGHHGDAGRYNDEVSTVVGVVAPVSYTHLTLPTICSV